MTDSWDRNDSSNFNSSNGHSRSGQRGPRRDGRDSGERRGTPLSELDPALTSVSHKLIGCARDVHMALGPGFDKSVYMTALQHELGQQGVGFKVDHPFDVKYKGHVVGQVRPDLFVGDRFLAIILAQDEEISSYQRVQLRAMLKAADLELGLIVNFAGKLLKDGLVRVLNPDKLNAGKQAAGDGEATSEGDQ
jgi:GxxExxY protein